MTAYRCSEKTISRTKTNKSPRPKVTLGNKPHDVPITIKNIGRYGTRSHTHFRNGTNLNCGLDRPTCNWDLTKGAAKRTWVAHPRERGWKQNSETKQIKRLLPSRDELWIESPGPTDSWEKTDAAIYVHIAKTFGKLQLEATIVVRTVRRRSITPQAIATPITRPRTIEHENDHIIHACT